MKAEEMIDKEFGRYTVISLAPRDSGGRAKALCRCQCGTEKIVDCYSLKKGTSTSCGCRRDEVTTARNITHGMCGTREHNIWRSMILRCTQESRGDYKHYGGKGVKICDEWLGEKGFENFYSHIGPCPSLDHTIDRKESNGHYEPGNVRWATMEEQARNKSNNRMLTYKGETKCLAEWVEITGLTRAALTFRIDRRGWSVEKALSTPLIIHRRISNIGHINN
jgi:hypothetical protein